MPPENRIPGLPSADDVRDMVLERATADEIHMGAVQAGLETMRVDGWNKIINGITTFPEVAKQTPKESDASVRREMKLALSGPMATGPAVVGGPAPGLVSGIGGGAALSGLRAPWESEAATKPR